MKLFHVSYDRVPYFKPRIPKYRLPEEDAITPRICLSTTVERCVNAKPHQAQALYLAREFGFRMPVYVYEFDTDDIPEDKLIGPIQLRDQYDVEDAVENNEYWLTADNVPYQEIRYEFIGGGFLPADHVSLYAEALRIKMVQEESEQCLKLEEAVQSYNLMLAPVPYRTCDELVIRFANEIAETLYCGDELIKAFYESS